jgi:nicotinamidase-related amidase
MPPQTPKQTPEQSNDAANDVNDLHGMVPDKSSVALLLIDVINDLEFEGADRLLRYIPAMAKRLAALKKRAKEAGIPVIYVNDNYGKWQSDFSKLIDRCLNENVNGRELVQILKPDQDDYFVLKPKHSAFFSTTLEVLLKYLNARTVILTGIAGNICILFTANDAYMRDLGLYVPSDCCASNEKEDNDYALRQIETILKADIRPSIELDLKQIRRDADKQQQRGEMPEKGANQQFGRQ